ncbi:MAG: hypothetical protein ACYC3I_21530 [Gemmataceae bacterium]
MELLIRPGGEVRCVYGEAIDLLVLGPPHITRASHVEPDEQGRWWADLSPVHGPRLGPFRQRTQALDAEQEWLGRSWLTAPAANARQ